MRRLRTRLFFGAVVVAAFGIGAVTAAWWVGLETSMTVVTEPPSAPITAEVVRRELVDTLVVRGRVAYGAAVSIDAPDLGDVRPVVTAVMVTRGDELAEGQVVAAVSDRPVIALAGAFPAYRSLTRGDRGSDVRQLQEALTRLGYYDDALDGLLGPLTERGLRRLYEDLGFEPPVEVIADTAAAADEVAVRGEWEKRVLRVPIGELAFVPELPSRVVDVRIAVGDVLTEGRGIVEVASDAARIVANLRASRIEGIDVGDRAQVLDETTGKTITAIVGEIGDEELSEEGLREYPVVLEPTESLDELVGKNLRVTFRLAASDGLVLTVPITAVWTSGDGTFVTVVDAQARRDVPVVVGVVVGGWVEISVSGAGLAEGDEVLVSR